MNILTGKPMLPLSKMMYLKMKKQKNYEVLYEGKEEGKGFLPNYWIDSKNPTKYLEKWLKHNKII